MNRDSKRSMKNILWTNMAKFSFSKGKKLKLLNPISNNWRSNLAILTSF